MAQLRYPKTDGNIDETILCEASSERQEIQPNPNYGGCGSH
jgi:hypothetical protein